MRVIDQYQEGGAVEARAAALLHPDGTRETVKRSVPAEHVLKVSVDGVPTMRVVCTPTYLVDLVIGRLFTEGIIGSTDDIEEVSLDASGSLASVTLAREQAGLAPYAEEVVLSCGVDSRLGGRRRSDEGRPAKVEPIPWEVEWVFAAARIFAGDSPLHRSTTGTHSCYLMVDGEIIVCCEDLGRHNAFDKVIGVALREGIDLRRALIFSSGRLPVDMVMKAIRAGVPVLVTKAVPTEATVRLAREFDLTLVCQARPDSAVVYNDPAYRRRQSGASMAPAIRAAS